MSGFKQSKNASSFWWKTKRYSFKHFSKLDDDYWARFGLDNSVDILAACSNGEIKDKLILDILISKKSSLLHTVVILKHFYDFIFIPVQSNTFIFSLSTFKFLCKEIVAQVPTEENNAKKHLLGFLMETINRLHLSWKMKQSGNHLHYVLL